MPAYANSAADGNCIFDACALCTTSRFAKRAGAILIRTRGELQHGNFVDARLDARGLAPRARGSRFREIR